MSLFPKLQANIAGPAGLALLLAVILAACSGTSSPSHQVAEGEAGRTPVSPSLVSTVPSPAASTATATNTATTAPLRPTPTFLSAAIPSTPSPTTDDTGIQDLLQITDSVALSRGLVFLREVQPELVGRRQMADRLVSGIDAEDRQDMADLQELYWILGLLDPSRQLYPLFLELLEEQVIGLFDMEEEDLLVLAESLPLDAKGQLTLAHELVHALQAQHFEAFRLVEDVKGSPDSELAVRALLEGDATFSSTLYSIDNIDLRELLTLLERSESAGSPVFDAAPPVLQKTLTFPYDAGYDFITALWETRFSWTVVNAAYGRPPSSTEQVLHPVKYLAGEAPLEVSLPPMAARFSDQWSVVSEGALGEFLLRTYLESGLADSEAERAAAGWGGDRFQVLRSDSGDRTFVYLVAWDTAEEAREFFDEYRRFTDGLRDWEADDAGETRVQWHSPGRWVLLEREGDRVFIAISPDQETARLLDGAFPG